MVFAKWRMFNNRSFVSCKPSEAATNSTRCAEPSSTSAETSASKSSGRSNASIRSATSTGPLLTSAKMLQCSATPTGSSTVSQSMYAPRSALISTSCFGISPFLKAFSCFEESNLIALGLPSDHATFERNASLGSALSTMIALSENRPKPTDVSSSHFLYASTRLLLAF